ncbi:MAG: class I SAM-dependent methyltransferase [Chloroflexi bacterium]|nr:class I SAM-dependent methyltransferase [Chloroflexota bacterium]
MAESVDTNAAVWKSDATAQEWVKSMDARERKRADQLAFMARLLPFGSDEAFTVVDLGAGTGAAARAVLDAYPRAEAILADFSPQMMDQGARVLAPYEGRYRYVEFDLRDAAWPAAIPARVGAVLTSQSVHHLPDERKHSLFGEIFERLAPGGWYVNFDPVKALDPAVEATWQRVNDTLDPDARHLREHRNPQEELRWQTHVRYMTDAERQLEWLRAVGFEAVDVYWKQLDYLIFAGRRPAEGHSRPGSLTR